ISGAPSSSTVLQPTSVIAASDWPDSRPRCCASASACPQPTSRAPTASRVVISRASGADGATSPWSGTSRSFSRPWIPRCPDECGVRKPDPAIFDIALERLGMDRKEVVHVGDDPILDVEGARAAGLRVIQLAPGQGWASRYTPDAVIERLRDLPGVLADLERS